MSLVCSGVHWGVRAGGWDGRPDILFVDNVPASALGDAETPFVRLIRARRESDAAAVRTSPSTGRMRSVVNTCS